MADLSNVTPVNGNSTPVTQEGVQTTETVETLQTPQTPASPPPATQERNAAKEAADQEAKEKAKVEAVTAEEEEVEGEDDDKELDTTLWGDPGEDEVGRSTLTLIQNSGLTPEDALDLFGKARESMNPDLVDRDKLVEKVGKTKANLIMAGFENVTTREKDRVKEVTATVTKVAGSSENWATAAKWANAKMDPNDLDEMRDMIQQGGKKAEFAASQIIEAYNADPKNTALNAGKGQLTPDAKATSPVKGITRREYGNQLLILQRKNAPEAEFKALSAKRQAGIKQGL